jgi:UDP-N-acetylglucosamine:LPS N-acetylglucosamine transferase
MSRARKVLAVASGGGHWVQLLRLRPALENTECIFVTVDKHSAADVYPAKFETIPDANRDSKLRLIWLCLKMLWIVVKHRPYAVISTGAAPGYIAIRIAKVLGAKSLFIDSIANSQRLSLSGELAAYHADLMLTQWPELSRKKHVKYAGSVVKGL